MQRGIVTAVAVLVAALAAAVAFTPAAMGQEAGDTDIRIEEAWARPGLSGGTSAVYFTLAHEGDEPVALVGADADVAATVELHETVLSGGSGSAGQMMRMQRIDSLVVAPGETVAFVPGGLHVMLIGLHRGLAEGDEVVVSLQVEGRDPVVFRAPVLTGGPAGADHHHDHDHHHHHDHDHDHGHHDGHDDGHHHEGHH